MKLTKRSDEIRKTIGNLLYEQQLYQQSENDEAIDRVEAKISRLRSQLLLVEKEEKENKNELEDHG